MREGVFLLKLFVKNMGIKLPLGSTNTIDISSSGVCINKVDNLAVNDLLHIKFLPRIAKKEYHKKQLEKSYGKGKKRNRHFF